MNPNEDKALVEARLERSLRRQIQAPKLDGRFDAAVWSRIAAESQAARGASANAARPPHERARHGLPGWLVACNVVGFAVTVILLAWYALRSFGGIESADLGFTLPSLSSEQMTVAFQLAGYAIGAVATGFGLLFTRAGRRVLASLR